MPTAAATKELFETGVEVAAVAQTHPTRVAENAVVIPVGHQRGVTGVTDGSEVLTLRSGTAGVGVSDITGGLRLDDHGREHT